MSGIEEPTLGFIETHPADAARVLEQLPRQEAVALMCAVPARLAVPVLRAMSSFSAARCLEVMPVDNAARLLQRLGVHSSSSILRYLPTEGRETLLASLPTASAVACRLLLGYPEDTVGSLVDLSVLAMLPATTVAVALDRIGRAADDPGDFLYVVDTDGRLVGQLRVAELLRNGEQDQHIGALMRDAPETLSAQLSLNAAQALGAWTEHPVLPVNEASGRFLGVLHHHRLARALQRVAPDPVPGLPGMATAMGAAYWALFGGLIRAAVATIPVQGPHSSREA